MTRWKMRIRDVACIDDWVEVAPLRKGHIRVRCEQVGIGAEAVVDLDTASARELWRALDKAIQEANE